MRYAAPLVLLAAIAMAITVALPLAIAVKLGVAPQTPQGRLALGWSIAAFAWVFQLWLVAGAGPCARAKLAQSRAFTSGLFAMLRAIVPWAIAIPAIGLGLLAPVLPGLLPLGLLGQT